MGELSCSDKSYCLSLVEAFVLSNPRLYNVYVGGHTQLRYSSIEHRLIAVRVQPHFRRLATYAKLLPTLNCVCSFERLVKPALMEPPMTARKQQFEYDGSRIPRPYRVLIWV